MLNFPPEEIITVVENKTTYGSDSLMLTNDQKLGMIVSVIKDKMDSQQLKHAVREIKSILES